MEITRMWNLNTTTIPVVIGPLYMIKNSYTQIKKIPGNLSLSYIK